MNIQVPIFITVLCAYFTGKNATPKPKPFLLCAAGLVLCAAGFAVNFSLHSFYTFYSYHNTNIRDLNGIFFQQIGKTIYDFILFLGYAPGSKFMSAQGFLSFASVIVLFLVFYLAAKIIKNRDGEAAINVSFLLFFIVSTVYHIMVFQLVGGEARYLMPLHILYIPALAIIFESVKKNMPELKARLFVSGIAFVIICGGVIRLHDLPSYDRNGYRKDSIAYLEKNKLRFGFATFWNANVITELTNGRIEMLGYGWLYNIAYDDPDYYKDETFLLLTKEELVTPRYEKFASRKPDYEDDYFAIFRYPSSAAVFDEKIEF